MDILYCVLFADIYDGKRNNLYLNTRIKNAIPTASLRII